MQSSSFFSLNIRGNLISLDRPWIMGILNLSPDSFFSESRNSHLDTALAHCEKMISEGANIIDIGAVSTRPNSSIINKEEEWNRLKLILPELKKSFPKQIFSIDTSQIEIMQKSIDYGIDIINDISGGEESKWKLAAQFQAPYIAMHIQGTPQTMQINPTYEHIIQEVYYYFTDIIERSMSCGLNDLIIDVGIGFGKTIEHNFSLIKHLDFFKNLNCPILMGISRKGTIYKTLDTTPENALNGTSALHFDLLRQGANILRVHDVKEAQEVAKIYQAYSSAP